MRLECLCVCAFVVVCVSREIPGVQYIPGSTEECWTTANVLTGQSGLSCSTLAPSYSSHPSVTELYSCTTLASLNSVIALSRPPPPQCHVAVSTSSLLCFTLHLDLLLPSLFEHMLPRHPLFFVWNTTFSFSVCRPLVGSRVSTPPPPPSSSLCLYRFSLFFLCPSLLLSLSPSLAIESLPCVLLFWLQAAVLGVTSDVMSLQWRREGEIVCV